MKSEFIFSLLPKMGFRFIHWSSLGIDKVFTAGSALEAKTIQKILKKQTEENLFSFGKTVFSHKELFLENILKDWFEAPSENSTKKLNLLYDMGFSLTPDTNIFLLKLQVLSQTEESLSFSQYQTCLNLLTTKLERQFSFRIALYTTPALPFAQLTSGVQAIQSLSTDNILLKPGIYFPKPQTSEISAVYCDSKLLESFHLLFTNYIRANMDKPIKCSDIAQAVYLSPGYITRLLQKEKGISLLVSLLPKNEAMSKKPNIALNFKNSTFAQKNQQPTITADC